MGVEERVDIKVNAETYAAKKALQDLALGFEFINTHSDKTGNTWNKVFGRGAADIGKFTLGMIGAQSVTQVLSTAVNRLNAEWDNFIQRADKAAASQTRFADAERQMANVLGDMSMKQGRDRVMQIARRTGIDPSQVALGSAAALSGKGETLKDEYAFSAISEAANFMPGARTQASQLSGLASAILMIQKDDPTLSAKQAMAFVSNTMRADRSESIEDLSKYLLPTIVRARGYGSGKDDLSYLASMGTAIGQRAEDPSGQTTSTAMEAFLKQIKLKTLPHVGREASVQQQMEFLHGTAEGRKIRQGLLGGLFDGDVSGAVKKESSLAAEIGRKLLGEDVDLKTGRGRMLIPLSELLQDKDNLTKRTMQANAAAIPSPHSDASLSAYQKLQAEISSSPSQQTAALERGLSGTSSTLTLPNSTLGARGQLRKQLPELLQQSGVSDTVSKAVMAAFDVRSATAENRSGVIDAGTKALEAGITPEVKYVGGPGYAEARPADLTAEQKETNALLKDLITTLQNQKLTIEQGDEEKRGTIAADRAGGG